MVTDVMWVAHVSFEIVRKCEKQSTAYHAFRVQVVRMRITLRETPELATLFEMRRRMKTQNEHWGYIFDSVLTLTSGRFAGKHARAHQQ